MRATIIATVGCGYLMVACGSSTDSSVAIDAGPLADGDGSARTLGVDSGTNEDVAAPESGEPAPPDAAGGSPLLLVAAGGEGTGQATLGFSYDAETDTWTDGTSLGNGTRGAIDSPNGAVSFAFNGPSSAVALLTDATDTTDTTGASGPLQFATWTAGQWSPFTVLAPGVNASGAPSLAVGPSSLEIAFAADGTKAESTAALSGGAWSTVTTLGASLKGGPPSIAQRGTDITVVYVRSSDGALVAADRASTTWGSETVIEPGTAAAAPTSAFPPSLVALNGAGPELMVVYTDSNTSDLHYATRTGTTWSSVHDFGLPTKVNNTDPNRPNPGAGDSPSPSFPTPVLALPGGKAILAFISVNQYAYFSEFDGTSWSTASTVFNSWGLDTIDSAQVGLAAGIGNATAEVVFGGSPDSSGTYTPFHTRRIAGTWTTPKSITSTASGFALYALASP